MSSTIREQLAAALEPHLPGFKIVPGMRNVDVQEQRFVQLALQQIEPLPAAPNGKHLATFTVTVVTALTEPVKAEDDLDESVIVLLIALDAIDWLDWSLAQKVIYSDRHLAYDVTVTAVTENH